MTTAEVKPLIWHDYEYFDEILDPGHCFERSRTPYAVSVHINSISGPGDEVEVTIIVGGIEIWGGLLSAGESSSVITCNDQYTVVHIANPYGSNSGIWIHVIG
ncbi:MAG: hypothetical protein QXD04_00740 [Candidatus Bathyarchaeia archaeon]